jgi:hypothetical protein
MPAAGLEKSLIFPDHVYLTFLKNSVRPDVLQPWISPRREQSRFFAEFIRKGASL